MQRDDIKEDIRRISREEAMMILEKEPLRHFTMRALLYETRNAEIHAFGNCIHVRDLERSDGFAYLAVDPEQDCSPLLPLFTGKEELVHVQGDMAADYIRRRFATGRDSDCIQHVLPETVPVQGTEEGIVDLKADDAEYILQHYSYKDVTTVEYLRSRIAGAPAVGVLVEGVLAGFVMTHEEMTMGVMQVLPEYRRMGLATRLNAALVRRMRERGLPCIVEIVKDNTASLALAASTGYVPLQKTHWIHLKQTPASGGEE